MGYLDFIKRTFSPDLKVVWGDTFGKSDPSELKATGSQIYHGRQRQGKTLGMVNDFHAVKRRYPNILNVSNITLYYRIVKVRKKFLFFKYTTKEKAPFTENWVHTLKDLHAITSLEAFKTGEWQKTNYIRYMGYDALLMLLKEARNGKWGVHFMIDEIHSYFHSHDSKSMPVWVAQLFSQQMKQYILITGTVQKWPNLIKALREQIENLIFSSKTFGFYIRQVIVDPEDIESQYGEEVAIVKKTGGFFMTKLVRESYDTLALIKSGREIFGGSDTASININTSENKKPAFSNKKNLAKYGYKRG